MTDTGFNRQNSHKVLLMLVVLGAVVAGAWIVVSYEAQLAELQSLEEASRMTHQIFLEDHEFSTVIASEDHIYVGGNDGVFRIDLEDYNAEPVTVSGLSFEVVRALVLSDDLLWVGHAGGITVLEGQTVVAQYDTVSGLPDNRVNDLVIRDGVVYAATFGGIAVIKGRTVRAVTEREGLIKDITKTVYMDGEGQLWCGSYTSTGGGVTLFEVGQWDTPRYFTTENGLSHNAITGFAETADGDIWVGNGNYTVGGATRYKMRQGLWAAEEVLTADTGLIGEKVRHIFIDPESRLWICSESDGITVLEPDKETRYLTRETGLSDNEVKKIVLDSTGNMWLASRRGITLIDVQWLEEYFR